MTSRHRYLIFTLLLTTILLIPWAVSETVMVPMKDGTKLATDYYLPATGGPQFPVLLVRTVYGKGGGAGFAPQFNGMGLALVVQDTRGRGASEGKDMVFADDGWRQNQDGADTVAWVKAQPWCNGKIGTWGASALGITQVQMAGATTDVAAQAIIVATSDFYGHISYQGGVFLKSLCETWIRGQKSDWVLDIWHSHPTYDAFWRDYNAEARASVMTAPAVHVGGWFDIFQQGTINSFVTRQHQGGEGAKGNQKLIMGPWPHGVSRKVGDLELKDNFAQLDSNAYTACFLKYWLTGEQNGIMSEPAVHYYTLGDVDNPDAPGNEWRTANDWPPFPTRPTSYYLAEGGGLAAQSTDNTGNLSFTYDPKDPCPSKGGPNLTIPAGPFDQRAVSSRPDVLRFASEPLTAPLEVTGNVRVVLYVSTDAPDTDFTAKFVDIYPDGREILMLDGIRRLKFHNGYEKAEPVKPGDIVKLDIDLWSISLVVHKGHRIGVQISSSNYPRFEKNPNTGEDLPNEADLRAAQNTVHLGKEYPSALVLPVRAAAD